MKTRIFFTFLILIIGMSSCGQTPEQQKMIDDAKRMQDSIMNTPQMKDMMKQLEEQEKKHKEQQDKTETTKKNSKKSPNSNDDWYWRNTTASKQGRFEDWNRGAADIVMMYKMTPNQQKAETLKIGTIDANGRIQFDLPADVKTQSELSRRHNILFFDIQEASSLAYTNGETGYFASSSLFVMKEGQQLGTLTMGNSVKVTSNLTNQSTLFYGDEGYILYWAFAQDNCSLKVNEDWSGGVRSDGTNTLKVQTNVTYDLGFKKGWNLVKTEVIGKYDLDHERGLDVSWFKNHKHTILNSLPKEVTYYFKTQIAY